ncbi:MAG: prepilin-type N-terminal cleavage/methylation domain-containing protein [Oscillospiraceae bacterium]|nr:prepilin-type N-terminal cleavage/methylation domain-containing protein [Oscillospiraceae bacterium]
MRFDFKRLLSKKGLTLVEVMIATVIFSLITLAAFTMYQPIVEIAGSVRSDNDMQRIVNASENYVARQLRNAVEIEVHRVDDPFTEVLTDTSIMDPFTNGRTKPGDDPRALIIWDTSTLATPGATLIYDVRLHDTAPSPSVISIPTTMAELEAFRVFNTAFYSDIELGVNVGLNELVPDNQVRDRTFLQLQLEARRDGVINLASGATTHANILLSWIGLAEGGDQTKFEAGQLNKASLIETSPTGNVWVILYHNNIDMDRPPPEIPVSDTPCLAACTGVPCDTSVSGHPVNCPGTLPCWSCVERCLPVCSVSDPSYVCPPPTVATDCFRSGCLNCLSSPPNGLPCYPDCGLGCVTPPNAVGLGCGENWIGDICISEVCCDCGDLANCMVCRYRCVEVAGEYGCRKQITGLICDNCCIGCKMPPHLGCVCPPCPVSGSHDYVELSSVPSTCEVGGNGSVTFECTHCGDTTIHALPLADHDYTDINWEKLDDAQHRRNCTYYSGCGGFDTASHIWSSYSAPDERGQRRRYCTVFDCDAEQTGGVVASITDCECEPVVSDGGRHDCLRIVTVSNRGETASAFTWTVVTDVPARSILRRVNAVVTEGSVLRVVPLNTETAQLTSTGSALEIRAESDYVFEVVISVIDCNHSGYEHSEVPDKEETCTEFGWKDRLVCENCEGIVNEFESLLLPLGHEADYDNFDAWEQRSPATCEEPEYSYVNCVRFDDCGYRFDSEIGDDSLGGHQLEDVSRIGERCFGGIVTRQCVREIGDEICGATSTEPVPPETPEYDEDDDAFTIVKDEPTCTEDGGTEYVCIHCNGDADGHRRSASVIPALGHDDEHDDWAVKRAATCFEDGEEALVCGRNGCREEIDTRVLVFEIVFIAVDDVPATCTTDGYIDGEVCEVCEGEFDGHRRGGTVVDALGHDRDDWDVVSPSVVARCISEGKKVRTCRRAECGESDELILPATGVHDFDYDSGTPKVFQSVNDSSHALVCRTPGCDEPDTVTTPHETSTREATCRERSLTVCESNGCGWSEEGVSTLPHDYSGGWRYLSSTPYHVKSCVGNPAGTVCGEHSTDLDDRELCDVSWTPVATDDTRCEASCAADCGYPLSRDLHDFVGGECTRCEYVQGEAVLVWELIRRNNATNSWHTNHGGNDDQCHLLEFEARIRNVGAAESANPATIQVTLPNGGRWRETQNNGNNGLSTANTTQGGITFTLSYTGTIAAGAATPASTMWIRINFCTQIAACGVPSSGGIITASSVIGAHDYTWADLNAEQHAGTCGNCGNTQNQNHTWGEWLPTTAPVGGTQTQSCTGIGCVRTRDRIRPEPMSATVTQVRREWGNVIVLNVQINNPDSVPVSEWELNFDVPSGSPNANNTTNPDFGGGTGGLPWRVTGGNLLTISSNGNLSVPPGQTTYVFMLRDYQPSNAQSWSTSTVTFRP